MKIWIIAPFLLSTSRGQLEHNSPNVRSMAANESIDPIFDMEDFPIHDEYPEFSNWLNREGVLSNKLRMSTNESPRGPMYNAVEAMENGTPILSIPLHLIMSMQSAKSARTSILSEFNDLPDDMLLALHILEEKCLGPKSKWYPFFEHLPQKLPGTIYLPDDELESIKGSHIYRLTKNRLDLIKNYYDVLKDPVTSNAVDPPLFTSEEFTLENLKWAMGVLWAYSIPIENIEKKHLEYMIIPILHSMEYCKDCTNHLGLSSNNDSLWLFANEDIAPGQSIRLNIGRKTIDQFFLSHGFYPEGSIEESFFVPVSMALDTEDQAYAIKNAILEANNLTMDEPYIMTTKEPLSERTKFSMRIKLMKGLELQEYARALNATAIGIRNEYVVYRSMYQTCQTMLNTLENSITTVDDPSPTRLAADAMIAAERDVLLSVLEYVKEQWMSLLTSSDYLLDL